MKQFLLCTFLCIGEFAFGQSSGNDQFIKDSLAIVGVKLVRPQFKFDNRVTFYDGRPLSITGFDAGVLLSDKLRFTLGYYSMDDQLKGDNFMADGQEFGRFMKLKYGSLNTEFIYKDTRFLSLGMPVEIGAGVNMLENKNITKNELIMRQSGAIIFVNFGMSATFKPMRFLGLKGMVGYRKVAYNQIDNFNFDGFFTSIGLNIDIHAIVTDVKMYRLMKRYDRGNNLANAVEIITD
ncbi:MAG: hypothetical protein M3R17_14035 [Bacteroidota bacterium]|nr:hypothetical protein [Bacteroidota bacterium]